MQQPKTPFSSGQEAFQGNEEFLGQLNGSIEAQTPTPGANPRQIKGSQGINLLNKSMKEGSHPLTFSKKQLKSTSPNDTTDAPLSSQLPKTSDNNEKSTEELHIDDDDTPEAKKSKAPIAEKDLKEIQKVNEQNEKTVNNVTANFGNFNLKGGEMFPLNEDEQT